MVKSTLTLLYVRDDETDQLALGRLVRERALPWSVTYVQTLADARAALAANRFDIIVADYHLRDGHSTVLIDEVPGTPFVLLTDSPEEEMRLRTIDRAADDYLAKDPALRYLDALPLKLEETLRSKLVRDRELELTRTEDRLRASEERFRALVAASNDVLYRMSADWSEMIQLSGGSFLADTNVATTEWMDRYLHPEDQPHIIAAVRNAIRTKSTFELEHRVVRADGTLGWTFSRAVPILDRAGNIVEWFGAAADITDRKRSEAEADAARHEAERLNAELASALDTKDQLIAVVSHELRNPLTAISTSVILLRHACKGNERANRAIDIVERNTKLQTRLVNDLLDLSRLQRRTFSLQRAPTRLDQAVFDVVHAVEDDATQAGVHLTVDVESDLWVQGDADRLQQVVANLLTNALKFTAAGGAVSVGARRSNGLARVSVADTGMGIDRGLLKDIFSIFRQGEVAGKSKPGLGLGLALVKGLAEAHGGHVWAESEGVGKGSRFVVEFPIIAPPQESVHRPSARGQPASFAGPIRLLLVEDNQDTRTMLQTALEMRGYLVNAAPSGEEALSMLRREKPEILLSDIQMPPGMNGYELLRRARELPDMAELPAFAVTAYGQEEDVQQATQAGFIGHFVKPVNIDVLDRRIRELVGARP